MRLILSRKGFDSSSGGCPSPIFPDGSMIALPIPSRRSPIRYQDLNWRGRNLGEVVVRLTRGKRSRDYGAHLDPDLRPEIRTRPPDWRPAFGQGGSAQGHLRKQGVGIGDLFLFWGVFRAVDEDLRWLGRPAHYIWGWLQIGIVASVDKVVRTGGSTWRWAQAHPHWHLPTDPANTMYVAAERLSLPGGRLNGVPGSGVFDFVDPVQRLTAENAKSPLEWSLPLGFFPRGRAALTYHDSPARWSQADNRAHLVTVARGQEFVLDLELYPELTDWLADVIAGGRA